MSLVKGMRRVVVTPAGRRRYLELLHRHLRAQCDHFDQWILLMNTRDPADVDYCERLAADEAWIETRYAEGSEPRLGNANISRFLNQFCRDPDTVYLRLDDDIVYLDPTFVDTMFRFRINNPGYFLTYGNIINNAILTWVHQKLGNIELHKHTRYACMCDVGWRDPTIAVGLHTEFLRDPASPKWRFARWVATEYERISVNAISWFGKDLCESEVQIDEEMWLSQTRPRQLGRPNAVCGSAVCAHFAFHPQRDALDRAGLLDLYARLAPPM
jgi:hypothetical protein